ncbi:hypothetical protein [Pseudomonas phage PA1C]|nr:hypothetical protein [Pseudomonas phage PA1C]
MNTSPAALPFPNLMFLLLVIVIAIPVVAYIYLPYAALAISTGVLAACTCVLGIGNALVDPNAYDTPKHWREYRYYLIAGFGFFTVAMFAAANLKYAFKFI